MALQGLVGVLHSDDWGQRSQLRRHHAAPEEGKLHVGPVVDEAEPAPKLASRQACECGAGQAAARC